MGGFGKSESGSCLPHIFACRESSGERGAHTVQGGKRRDIWEKVRAAKRKAQEEMYTVGDRRGE